MQSTILDALRICLAKPITRTGDIFDKYDYHLSDVIDDLSKVKPIEIILTFKENSLNEWSSDISSMLKKVEQVDNESGLNSVIFKVTGKFDLSLNESVIDYDFLDLSGNCLPKSPVAFRNLQTLLPIFYLSSMRDAAKEFKSNSQFWTPFVKALNIDAEQQLSIENDLQEINEKILQNHDAFTTIQEKLKKTADILSLGKNNPVPIEIVPSRIFDILSRTQVYLSSKSGVKIPIARHGNGTQSLAVILLFEAFLQKKLEGVNKAHATPVLALEEPEAHLHPAAIKAVGEMLKNISGQKIISTHSGDLLSAIPLVNIRRISRKKGKICAHYIKDNDLDKHEMNKIDFKVRRSRGSLLFARCWLLVEGETEEILFSACARSMGIDLLAKGICCVEFTQIGGVDIFIKCADKLGIEWLMVADGDESGQKSCEKARKILELKLEEDHIFQLPSKENMEIFLCCNGFVNIYETTISTQKKNENSLSVTENKKDLQYFKDVGTNQKKNKKIPNAIAVAEKMIESNGDKVPDLLRKIINKAIDLSKDDII